VDPTQIADWALPLLALYGVVIGVAVMTMRRRDAR